MEHHFAARVVWTGAADGGTTAYDAYSREYLAEIDGKPPLSGSSAPAFLGNPGLHNPEDLLVVSLSACHMLWYLDLCARAGIVVTSYGDDASGTMAMRDGKMRFIEVVLRPKVVLAEGDPEKARELHQRANQQCFIANSVNFPVRHEVAVETAAGS